MTPLQTAIVTMHASLKEWVNCKEESDEMVFHTDKPGPHFLDDFKRDTILNLRGVHYEMREGIQAVTLKDAMYELQGPSKPPLTYAKTLIFAGAPCAGKSELAHGLRRECCQQRQKTKYGMSGSIDPFGLMTKSGMIKELGAIGFYDFELKARTGLPLSREEKKRECCTSKSGPT